MNNTVDEIELYIGTTLVPVEMKDLVQVDGTTPTPFYWEMWNGGFGQNKREMRQSGISPRKIDGRWVVGGAL